MIVTKNIYLIGMPGSGKTTIGHLVSRLLECHFFETDWAITKAANSTIGDIIKHQGEEAFRDLEEEVLNTTTNLSGAIVSTGGGLPCFKNNMSLMQANGIVVWLQVPNELLICRLKDRYSQIPALANTDLEQSIPDLLAYRSKWYKQADIAISLSSTNTEENALQVVKEITAYLQHEKKQ
ncbi:MAG: shikimate kinase [Flexibacteraceae bacterium]